MNENPDAVPETGMVNAGLVPTDISFSSTAQNFLNQTKPWIRFMSVMIFISAALMAVVGIGLMLMSIGTGMMPAASGRFGAVAPGIGTGFLYIILALVYVAPGIFLSRYASAIKLLQTNRSAQTLEDAMRSQKSFWRYVGILTIVGIALTIVAIVLVVVLAALFVNR